MKLFEQVKESITARMAAEMYGISVRHNGMCICPFHDDHDPSMKVDDRFHCFACGADGDVIDFVARLFRMTRIDAAKKIAADFKLNLKNSHSTDLKRNERKRQWAKKKKQKEQEATLFLVPMERYWKLKKWKEEYAPKDMDSDEEWDPRFCEAIRELPYIEDTLDTLFLMTEEELHSLIARKSQGE